MSTIDNQLQLPEYTKDDFLDSERPFEYVMSIQDRVKRRQTAIRMAEYAKSLKVTGFMKLLEDYMRSLPTRTDAYADNICSFQGQQMELKCGDWECSENGILRHTSFGDDYACVHPIMPIERYVNVDTGVEKLKVWWRKGKSYRTGIFDRRVLATASGIVALADHGVAVNSESAKTLVRWLHDAENLNYELIPEKQSVGRLGWIEGATDDEPLRFSPYSGTLEFDGDENFRSFFAAVKPSGTYKEWLAMAKEIRKNGITARVVLAASFASALVQIVGIKPFFVHMWGGAGNGKTVALMLAASVWANPEMGRYIHTFNSTSVGQEMAAAFVNSMPLIMDELQVIRNKQDFDETIYKLAEGVGRTRSNRNLGVSKSYSWSNCIITTGEMPITTGSSGGGAIDRVVNVECKDELFPATKDAPNLSARFIAQFTRKHYGHAGKRFIAALMKDGFEKVAKLHNGLTRQIEKTDATPRQSLAAALILTADTLANEYLYNDGNSLTVNDMVEFLATKSAVDVGERGYRYMCGWVATIAHKLTKNSVDGRECWGDLSDGIAYVERSKFDAAVIDAGFNPTALLSWCKQKGLIRTRAKGRQMTVNKPINRAPAECVALILPKGGEDDDVEFVEIPENETFNLPF